MNNVLGVHYVMKTHILLYPQTNVSGFDYAAAKRADPYGMHHLTTRVKSCFAE